MGGMGVQAAAQILDAAPPHTFSLAVSLAKTEPLGLYRWANALKLHSEYNYL